MKTIRIALKNTKISETYTGDWIGADRGAYVLAKAGIHMKLAVGDFDSVDMQEMELIRKYSDEVIQLNPIKDDSDSEHAVIEAMHRGYERIILDHPFGGRLDHGYVNLKLAYKYPELVYLEDEQNLVYAVEEGKYTLQKNAYKYISFFSENEAEISLTGFSYPLKNRRISNRDLYTVSNEIVLDEGILQVHHGKVLIIQCKDGFLPSSVYTVNGNTK